MIRSTWLRPLQQWLGLRMAMPKRRRRKADQVEALESRVLLSLESIVGNIDGTNGFYTQFSGDTSPNMELTPIGDVNADGFDDLAYYGFQFQLDPVFVFQPKSGVLFGGPRTGDAMLDLDALDSTRNLILTDDRDSVQRRIEIIRGVGDVNHDGIDDFAVLSGPTPTYRAPTRPAPDPLQALYIVHGRASFGTSELKLSEFSASDGTMFAASGLGADWSLIGDIVAGDWDGDGHQDLFVQWVDRTIGDPTDGEVWVDTYFGTSAGFGPVVNLDEPGSVEMHRFRSNEDRAPGLGFVWDDQTMDFGGDVNADGRPDLLLGGQSPLYDEEIYVIYGQDRPAASETILESISPAIGLKIRGRNTPNIWESMGSSAAFVGDVTGDGIDDMVIGAWQGLRPSAFDFGEVFLINGKAGGWAGGVFDLSSFSASEATDIYATGRPDGGSSYGRKWITGVSAAGDLNDDGINDFIFHAPADRATASHEVVNGAIYIVYGGPHLNTFEAIARPDISEPIGVRIAPIVAYPDTGSAVVHGDFDFDGDGGADFVSTGTGHGYSFVVYNPASSSTTGTPDIGVATSTGAAILHDTGVVNLDPGGYRTSGTTATVAISNFGDEDLFLQPAEFISGAGFTLPTNLSVNHTLQPGESTTIVIQTNTDIVGEHAARLRIVSNDPNESPYEFDVTGRVWDAPVLEVSVNGSPFEQGETFEFGTIAHDDDPLIQSFTVTNNGTAAASNVAIRLADNRGFAINISLNELPPLEPGASQTFSVKLPSSVPGNKSATLSVDSLTFQLSGNVTPRDDAPSLVSLDLAPATVPAATTIEFTAVFSEPVTGVDASDFVAATTGGTTAGTITVTEIDPFTFTVSVADVVGAGQLQLNLVDNRSITDDSGQYLGGSFALSSLATYGSGGDAPIAVTPADLDGDGFRELIVGHMFSPDLMIYPNNGDGTFGTAEIVPTGSPVYDVAVGDINGDGKPELAVLTTNAGGTISILRNTSGLSYVTDSTHVGSYKNSVRLTDFNTDGHKDIVFATSSRVGFIPGNGDGTFGSPDLLTNSQGRFEVAGTDPNGLPQIVSTDRVVYSSGSSRGIGNEFTVSGFAVGDLNLNDTLDYVYTSVSGDIVSFQDGFSGEETIFASGPSPFAATVQDINNDGWPDAVTADFQDGDATLYLGGSSGLIQAGTIEVGDSPYQIVSADLDQDGRSDLITVNRDTDELSVVISAGNFAGQTWDIGAPEIVVSDVNGVLSSGATIGYGSTRINEGAVLHRIKVRNTSTNNLVVQPATFASGEGYSIPQNFVANQIIGPGQTAELHVQLDDVVAGDKTATVQFTSDDPDEGLFEFTLTGSIIAPVELTVTTTADTGAGSFRQAVQTANQSLSDVVIRFDIPETDPGFVDIDASSGLPEADAEPDIFLIQQTGGAWLINNVHNAAVTVDGVLGLPDDPNPFGPAIYFDGAIAGATGHGVIVESDDVTVSDVGFQNFEVVSLLTKGDRTRIANSFFGVDGTGRLADTPGPAEAPGQRGIEVLDADGVIISSNLISGQSRLGLSITTSSNTTVTGNLIGTDVTGSVAIQNAGIGVHVVDSTNTTIGGLTPTDRNVISGNAAAGIEVRLPLQAHLATTDGLTIVGNIIGLNATANAAIPNEGEAGIVILGPSSNVVIGGTAVGAGNIISGNTGTGVLVRSTGTGHSIIGNIVGTDGSGTLDIGNGADGLKISGLSLQPSGMLTEAVVASNLISGNEGFGLWVSESVLDTSITDNSIGTNRNGDAAIANADAGIVVRGPNVVIQDNLVSGNGTNGIEVRSGSAIGAKVTGNIVGTNALVSAAIPNGGSGILITDGASQVEVGGANSPDRNIVAGNARDGIEIAALGRTEHTIRGNFLGTNATGSMVLGNGRDGLVAGGQMNVFENNAIVFNERNGISIIGFQNQFSNNLIHSNGGLGIDVGMNGISLNDPLDADSGPSNVQNYPEITSRTVTGGMTTINGVLNSEPNTNYVVEIYADAVSLSYGQGHTWLGSISVTTDSTGGAIFALTVNMVIHESVSISATATDPRGEMSEFSPEYIDLVGTFFDAADDHVLLGKTDVTVTISNNGNIPSGDFTSQVIWSPNTVLGDADDVIVATFTDTDGAPGGSSETSTLSIQLNLADLFAEALAGAPVGGAVGTVSMEASKLFLVVDSENVVSELNEANNIETDQGVGSDNVTYFPWDKNRSGTVEPLEALASIHAIGTNDPASDFDGNGVVTPLEALSALQRIGYVRSDVVTSKASGNTAEAVQIASMLSSAASVAETSVKSKSTEHPLAKGPISSFNQTTDDSARELFAATDSDHPRTVVASALDEELTAVDYQFESVTDWLSVL